MRFVILALLLFSFKKPIICSYYTGLDGAFVASCSQKIKSLEFLDKGQIRLNNKPYQCTTIDSWNYPDNVGATIECYRIKD